MRLLKLIRSVLLGSVAVGGAVSAEGVSDLAAQTHATMPGYALGVAQVLGSSSAEVYTFGSISKWDAQDVARDSSWHIGSITKSFTATLIMQLVETRLVDLDSPVGEYLEAYELHPDWQAITLRQLLSHTAGIPANAPMSAFRKRSTDDLHGLRHEILAAHWLKPLREKPGSYNYSNLGYVFAGFIAEVVTGETWEELIKSRIAAPLGLTTLGFGAPQQAEAAWGHRNYLLTTRPISPSSPGADNPPWLGPAGTLHLSLAELATWGWAHIAACKGELPALLSKESCRELQTEVADNYGLGWVIRRDAEAHVVWHNGSNTMWYAVLALYPEKDMAIAVATNVFEPKPIDSLVATLSQANP